MSKSRKSNGTTSSNERAQKLARDKDTELLSREEMETLKTLLGKLKIKYTVIIGKEIDGTPFAEWLRFKDVNVVAEV